MLQSRSPSFAAVVVPVPVPVPVPVGVSSGCGLCRYKIPVLGYGGCHGVSVAIPRVPHIDDTTPGGSSTSGADVRIVRFGAVRPGCDSPRFVTVRNVGARTAFLVARTAADGGSPPGVRFTVAPSHCIVPRGTVVALCITATRSSVDGADGADGSARPPVAASQPVEATLHLSWGDEYVLVGGCRCAWC